MSVWSMHVLKAPPNRKSRGIHLAKQISSPVQGRPADRDLEKLRALCAPDTLKKTTPGATSVISRQRPECTPLLQTDLNRRTAGSLTIASEL
jgi:hypothetical protein